MKLRLAIATTVLLAFATGASAASAAGLGASPAKKCYRAGTKLELFGGGYTPNSSVSIASDGDGIGGATTNGVGGFLAELTVGIPSGEKTKIYTATDDVNPALKGTLPLRVTALDVSLSPKSGRPGRRLKIRARGFTTGSRLYAHVRKGRRYRKNVRVGRLKGACHTIKTRKKLIKRGGGTGTYHVQFDTKRHYSRKTAVRVRYDVFVFRTFKSGSASAASVGERWVRVG
ncbi:MAG TPA: hypothetical protein VGF21_12915 [Thermoleophilaceae bacterium]